MRRCLQNDSINVKFVAYYGVSLNVIIRTSSLPRLLILAFFYLLTFGIFTTKGI